MRGRGRQAGREATLTHSREACHLPAHRRPGPKGRAVTGRYAVVPLGGELTSSPPLLGSLPST